MLKKRAYDVAGRNNCNCLVAFLCRVCDLELDIFHMYFDYVLLNGMAKRNKKLCSDQWMHVM